MVFKKFLILPFLGILFLFAPTVKAEDYNNCCICQIVSVNASGMGAITPGQGAVTYFLPTGSTADNPITDSAVCSEKNAFGIQCYIAAHELCGEIQIDTTKLKEIKFGDIILGVTIPNLRFSAPPTEVDDEGNIYIPWIGEYIKAVYNFSMIAISVIAVAVIIVQGLRISSSAGGPAKGDATKKIGQAVIGLLLAWGSYIILFAINPNLIEFRSLDIKFIDHLFFEEPADEIDTTTSNISKQIVKKSNKAGRNSCLADLPSGQGGFNIKEYGVEGTNPNGKHGAYYVSVNKLMLDDLRSVMEEISQKTTYKIKAIGGQRGTGVCTAGSLHRCGLAVDINPGDNPDCPARSKEKSVGQYWDVAGDHKITEEEMELCKNGGQVTDIPPEVITIFENHGFYWGGNGWGKQRSDAMHFEYHKYCYE